MTEKITLAAALRQARADVAMRRFGDGWQLYSARVWFVGEVMPYAAARAAMTEQRAALAVQLLRPGDDVFDVTTAVAARVVDGGTLREIVRDVIARLDKDA